MNQLCAFFYLFNNKIEVHTEKNNNNKLQQYIVCMFCLFLIAGFYSHFYYIVLKIK